MQSYSSVYLKPSKGKAGKGIMKLERRSGNHKRREFRLSIQDGKLSHISSYPDIRSVWNRIKLLQINTEDYIVQQGIDLASYKQRPYDLRVLMQKKTPPEDGDYRASEREWPASSALRRMSREAV